MTSWTFQDEEYPPPPPKMSGDPPIPLYSELTSIDLERHGQLYAVINWMPSSISWTHSSNEGPVDKRYEYEDLETVYAHELKEWIDTVAMPHIRSLPLGPDVQVGEFGVHDFLYMGYKQVWVSVRLTVTDWTIWGWRERQ